MRPEVVYTKGLEVLAKFGHERSFSGLVKQSDHWHEDVRRSAVKALGNFGDESFKPLIKRLLDSDEGVRRETRRAIGKIGVDETVEPLIRGDETAVEPLIEKLSGNEYVREAMLALGDLGDKRAVRPLIEKLSDPDEGIRIYARKALVSLDDESANRLLERFRAFDSRLQDLVYRLAREKEWSYSYFFIGEDEKAPLAWNLAKGNEVRFQINLQILEDATKQFAVTRPDCSEWHEMKRIKYSEFIYTVARYAMEQKFSPENSSQFFKLFLDNIVITTTVYQKPYTASRQGGYLGTETVIFDYDHDPEEVAVYEQISYEAYLEIRTGEEDIVATFKSLKANYPEVLESYIPRQEG